MTAVLRPEMATRWTLRNDWTMVSSVRALISCCFKPSLSGSASGPLDHSKRYGSNGQLVKNLDDRGSTHSVIPCGKRSRKNPGREGRDSGVVSEGEGGSPRRNGNCSLISSVYMCSVLRHYSIVFPFIPILRALKLEYYSQGYF